MKYKYIDIDSKLNTTNKDLRLSVESEAINNSIKNILTIQKGTLPGNPEFGTNLEEVLFDIIDDITLDYLRNIVFSELTKQEPRIIVNLITFITNIELGQILVNIKYTIIHTNEIESSLVKITI